MTKYPKCQDHYKKYIVMLTLKKFRNFRKCILHTFIALFLRIWIFTMYSTSMLDNNALLNLSK